MSDTIYYDYGANLGTLDTLTAAVHDAETLRTDVGTVFTALTGGDHPVYQGQAAEALQGAHIQVSQQMDHVIGEIRALLNLAVERQYITQAQDNQLAQGL